MLCQQSAVSLPFTHTYSLMYQSCISLSVRLAASTSIHVEHPTNFLKFLGYLNLREKLKTSKPRSTFLLNSSFIYKSSKSCQEKQQNKQNPSSLEGMSNVQTPLSKKTTKKVFCGKFIELTDLCVLNSSKSVFFFIAGFPLDNSSSQDEHGFCKFP